MTVDTTTGAHLKSNKAANKLHGLLYCTFEEVSVLEKRGDP